MVDFQLSIDEEGKPIIKFRHHNRSDELAQKLLGRFVTLAKEKGLTLINPSGYLNTSGESHENYEITISN